MSERHKSAASVLFHTKRPAVKTRMRVGHYELGDNLAKGGFGTVSNATELHTGSTLVVKQVNLLNLSEARVKHLKTQIEVNRLLSHKNIAKMYEVIETSTRLYMFMEKARGEELFHHIVKHGPISEERAVRIFHQLVTAVKYMHGKGVAHRDLKTENIILDARDKIKVIDFGLACIFNPKKKEYSTKSCGSSSYVAPELALHQKYLPKPVDVWCLGVVLFVMLEGVLPFDSIQEGQLLKNIVRYKWHTLSRSSPEARELYNSIFAPASTRIQVDGILRSSLFAKHNLALNTNIELPGRSPNRPRLQQEAIRQDIVQEASRILKVSPQQVRDSVVSNRLGEHLAVYHLLAAKLPAHRRIKTQSRAAQDYSLRASLFREPTNRSSSVEAPQQITQKKGFCVSFANKRRYLRQPSSDRRKLSLRTEAKRSVDSNALISELWRTIRMD